jgi:hypothetical protein
MYERSAFVLGLAPLAVLLSCSTGVTHPPVAQPAPPVVAAAPPAAALAPPAVFHRDAGSACTSAGGTYLGELKCQMRDGSIQQIARGRVDPETQNSQVPAPPNSPHAWALATTAIMFEINESRHDLLGGAVTLPENVQWGKQLLSEWWGVSDRQELLSTLSWLQLEGHRAEFEELGRQVDAMTEQQFSAAVAAAAADPEELNSLQVVRRYHRALGESGILGWDLVRYIALCRWGYLAGYMTRTEAWDRIMPAARRMQEAFSSWQALQNDYLIGREFWSAAQTQKYGERYRAVVERFLEDPNSPWNVNPWAMNLQVAAPLLLQEQ